MSMTMMMATMIEDNPLLSGGCRRRPPAAPQGGGGCFREREGLQGRPLAAARSAGLTLADLTRKGT